MSKEEAVHRCQIRLNDLGANIAGVESTEHRTVVEQGIQDTKKIISQLEQSSDSTELYRLSSACHDALFALEWIVHQYSASPSVPSLADPEKADVPTMAPTEVTFKKTNVSKKIQVAKARRMVKMAKAAKVSKKSGIAKKKLLVKKLANKKASSNKLKNKSKRKKTKRSLKTA
jgi:hypothetical protein